MGSVCLSQYNKSTVFKESLKNRNQRTRARQSKGKFLLMLRSRNACQSISMSTRWLYKAVLCKSMVANIYIFLI